MHCQSIAILTNGIFPHVIGGIQKHSYYLAKYLAKEKIFVDVYHSGENDSNKVNTENHYSSEELKYLNFIKIDFPSTVAFPGHYVYASWLFSKKIYTRLANEKKYDCIYAQGFTSWYFLKQNPFQNNLISNLHGLNMFQKSINLKNKIELFLLKIPGKEIIRKSYKQVSLGGKLTEILYNAGAKKNSVVVIPNGIDESWISDSDIKQREIEKKLRFVFVGRYERLKGIEEFQEVIKKTIDTFGYEVAFIGPIPIENQIKHLQVNYLGAIKDSAIIKTQLQNADILVCPSYSEGMPTVILEAMACGCAIIATDVGAVNTMVNQKNGWLIEGDIVSGLQAAIQEAINNTPGELTLKKQYSIDKVKNNFTWEQVIKKTIKAIKI